MPDSIPYFMLCFMDKHVLLYLLHDTSPHKMKEFSFLEKSGVIYTRPKKKLLAFSFAKFEMASWSNYTDQKKVTP